MVLPGFFDSHSHPSGALIRAVAVYLYDGRSLEQYLDVLREYADANPEREAIRGAGWSNTLFPPTGPRFSLARRSSEMRRSRQTRGDSDDE